jgi:uncharacterized membrane protein
MSFLYGAGTALCHQIDERTFHFNGHTLMVCARDTGTYTGFIISMVYWMIVNKKIKGGMPPGYALITASIFIGTLVIDGGTSYLHMRETNNQIRLLTGLLAGAGSSILIVPCVFDLLYKYSSGEIFTKNKKSFLLWISVIIILFFIIRTEYGHLYYILTATVTAGMITMITMVNSVLLYLIPPWNKRIIKNWKSFFYFLIPALLLTVMELYTSFSIHMYVKQLGIVP